MKQLKSITVVFFRTPVGNEPARDWLKGLSASDKKIIGEDLKAVEYSWPVGLPLVRKLEADLPGGPLYPARPNRADLFHYLERQHGLVARIHQESAKDPARRA